VGARAGGAPPASRRRRPAAAARQWLLVESWEEGTIGRLMDRPLALFRPDTTVGEAIDRLRELTRKAHIVYGFVTDGRRAAWSACSRSASCSSRAAEQPLSEVMVREPFALRPELTVIEAAREVVTLHVAGLSGCATPSGA